MSDRIEPPSDVLVIEGAAAELVVACKACVGCRVRSGGRIEQSEIKWPFCLQ